MERALPLGAFAVDDLGRIALRNGQPAGFAFRWRGRDLRVELDEAPDKRADGRIRLSARAGRVPSSALGATLRPDAFEIVKRLALMLPTGWRATLQADHVLTLSSETRMALPAMIGEVLVPATRFALGLAPYLDLLEQYGMDMNA